MVNKLEFLIRDRNQMRGRWNEIRDKKIKRKKELLIQGLMIASVRQDKMYRALKKEQKSLSKMIRHSEIKINRYINNMSCIDEK